MRVGENTSQAVSVGFVRLRQTAAFSKKWKSHFFDRLRHPLQRVPLYFCLNGVGSGVLFGRFFSGDIDGELVQLFIVH